MAANTLAGDSSRELDDLLATLSERLVSAEDRIKELSLLQGGVGGSGNGVAGRVALWSSATGLTSDAGLTFVGNVLATTGGITVGAANGAGAGQAFITGATGPIIQAIVSDAGTTNAAIVALFEHITSGTPAASFGLNLNVDLHSSNNTLRHASATQTFWNVATEGSQMSTMKLFVYDVTTARLGMQIVASSGAASVTFPNDVTIGLTTETAAASLDVILRDSATASSPLVTTLHHRTSGTPAAGFGTLLRYNADSSDNTLRAQADIYSDWGTATDASRKARLFLRVYDTAAREGLRIEASGSAAMIGFLGAAAVVKQATITQTYATTSTTLAADTAANFPAGGTGTAAGGWDTAGNRDLAITRFNALRADVDNVKNVLNTVIDSLQAYGLNG